VCRCLHVSARVGVICVWFVYGCVRIVYGCVRVSAGFDLCVGVLQTGSVNHRSVLGLARGVLHIATRGGGVAG
jgi:hypothetical protein